MCLCIVLSLIFLYSHINKHLKFIFKSLYQCFMFSYLCF